MHFATTILGSVLRVFRVSDSAAQYTEHLKQEDRERGGESENKRWKSEWGEQQHTDQSLSAGASVLETPSSHYIARDSAMRIGPGDATCALVLVWCWIFYCVSLDRMEHWRQCALWLINCKVLPPNHRVTWESAQVFDLAQTLRDGVLLCQLLNNLRPQSINLREINLRPQMSQVRDTTSCLHA